MELAECTPRSLALSRSTSEAILLAIRSSADGRFLSEVVEAFHSGFSSASLLFASETREM